MGRFLVLLMVALPVSAADWSALDRYQNTITRTEFESLLTNVYDPSRALTGCLSFASNSVTIATNFTLQFDASATNHQSLAIRRVVLDPGHIGGAWARMEERWFQRSRDRPVQEAALNLTVARRLKQHLEAAGLTVFLTKDNFQPVTDKRPDDFRAQAERETPASDDEADRADAVHKRTELLFYRSAEIAARARRINEEFKPDLTICIHFNAVEWNECHDLVDDNRLVVFVHGNYLGSELADDKQKFRLFAKLLERSHTVELSVAEALASALAKATGLPPVGGGPYVRLRNLAANQLYNGPVVYLEPYYMNNRLVYRRIQLGDYEGTRQIDGKTYKSIFREYADAVVQGLSTVMSAR